MKSGNDCYNRKDRLTERRSAAEERFCSTPFKKIREVIDLKTVKTAKKGRCHTAAAIDIGSKLLRMRIAQMSKGNLQDLEYWNTRPPLAMRSLQTAKSVSRVSAHSPPRFTDFQSWMENTGVSSSRVVATTALREAANRAFVVDQLKVQSGMQWKFWRTTRKKLCIRRDRSENPCCSGGRI